MVLVGAADTSRKPVTNVPTRAPAVDTPLSRPTTRPVRSRSCSWSFTTIGCTALEHERGEEEPGDGEPDGGEAAAVAALLLPSDRTTGTVNIDEQAAERDRRAEQAARVDAVGEPCRRSRCPRRCPRARCR